MSILAKITCRLFGHDFPNWPGKHQKGGWREAKKQLGYIFYKRHRQCRRPGCYAYEEEHIKRSTFKSR